MNYRLRLCGSLVLGSLLAASVCASAKAEDEPAAVSSSLQTTAGQTQPSMSPAGSPTPGWGDNSPGWHYDSLSYLWFPGIHGVAGARGFNAGLHVSAADILKNFDIGIMGAFEARNGRWVIPVDYVWVKLSDNKALNDFPDYSLKARVKEGIFTPKVGYVVINSPKAVVEATAGPRIWYLSENLKFNPNPYNYSFGTSQSWVDFVAGANIVVPVTPKIALLVLGDAGGGGAHTDYQVAAQLGYQLKPKWAIGAGYRYLDVNYRGSNQFVFDATESGLILTLVFKYGKVAGQ
jgi:hypothetical protein